MRKRRNRMPTASVQIKSATIALATANAVAAVTTPPTTSAAPVNTTCEPLRLTHIKPSFNNHELALAARQDLWHKFIIFDVGEFSMETILDSILSACQPEVILPVQYQVDDSNKATFLAKCTITAIDTFVKQGLMIRLPEDHILKMDIVLGFINMQDLDINLHRIIADVLNSRYDGVKKILNLEDFHHDKQLGSLYCPLSSSGVLILVLKCCKMRIGNSRDNKLQIRELNLRNNRLFGILLYEKLFGFNLTKLDLSHNKISNIDYLRYFSEFKVTELCLDGNPFCEQFNKPEDYIQAVKYVFPNLQKLDGVIIDVKHQHIPLSQKYFLADGSRMNLVRQFVQHYFTLFDQKDRTDLNGLYESNAFFSATFGDIANPRHRQLTKILNINRNLLKVVDYSRCYKYLLNGAGEIIDSLRKLPPTFHNYKTFSIDILHQGNKHLAINIQGPFFYREFPISLFFSRTFIIVEKEDREFRIVNDQYHIRSGNATMIENSNASAALNVVPDFTPTYLGEGEKNDLVKFLSNVSTMKMSFCREFLEQSDWNLRDAISKFMKSYSVNDIPPQAFESKY
ncbi:nuclear RNA export factor 1-like [Microplitis mediator]|uniref:nuclear RNA export factor 1-like n=1 Tax=Microplitis mediator TaxID=375433 RepID=UPI00255792A9|nr:nuclear RNA export factor 1-like [Microplitis mediator]